MLIQLNCIVNVNYFLCIFQEYHTSSDVDTQVSVSIGIYRETTYVPV